MLYANSEALYIYKQGGPRTACAFKHSDQGLSFPLSESLLYVNEQRRHCDQTAQMHKLTLAFVL